MLTSARVFYSGTVQGVGFRYTVQRFADQLRLTGWVRNLPDGRVELEVQGDRTVIEQLLKQIDQRYDGSIKDRQVDWSPPQGKFTDFQITF